MALAGHLPVMKVYQRHNDSTTVKSGIDPPGAKQLTLLQVRTESNVKIGGSPGNALILRTTHLRILITAHNVSLVTPHRSSLLSRRVVPIYLPTIPATEHAQIYKPCMINTGMEQ